MNEKVFLIEDSEDQKEAENENEDEDIDEMFENYFKQAETELCQAQI